MDNSVEDKTQVDDKTQSSDTNAVGKNLESKANHK